LLPGGFLFLGPAETLRGLSQDFHLRHSHETFYYQRRLPDERVAVPAGGAGLEPTRVETWGRVLAAADESWVAAIGQASERIARLSRGVSAPASLDPGDEHRRRGGRAVPPENAAGGDLGTARELVRQERFEDALDILQTLPRGEGQDPDVQLLHAVILTNQGRVAEAEQLCRQVLAGDELNAEAHYLLALCREHAGEYATAVEEDRTAIYLDPQFAMPHLHLGLLARRTGDREAALRAFRQAAALLPREDAPRILLFGGGFSRELLVQLCQAELRAGGGES
jgi:chemotaxis protein methyltransferase CheR